MLAEKNKFYPLPYDYDQLTAEGRRQARVAVLTDHSTAKKFVTALYCFRQWYLVPMPGHYQDFKESPPFHYQAAFDLYTYDYNLLAAPRGFAKSVFIGADTSLFLLITIDFFDIAKCLCIEKMIPRDASRIMTQIENNPYIIRDFGKLRSSGRGSESWSKHFFQLKNGSSMEYFSTEGRKRGARPRLFIFDDPEFDTEKEETSSKLIEAFYNNVFRVVIPMLRRGSKLFWIGTVINRRTSIYKASQKEDERFQDWNIRILSACRIDEKDRFQDLLWPAEWTAEALKEKRKKIGLSAFSAEYLNNPVSEQSRLFEYDQIRNTYQVSAQVPVSNFPLNLDDKAVIKYHLLDEKTGRYEPVEEIYRVWVNSLYRVILVDFAHTVTSTSDFNCVMTVGICRRDILWPLDLWIGRTVPSVLHKEIMRQGVKWQVHQVSPEAVTVQYRLMQAAEEAIRNNAERTLWVPKVIPPEYPRNTEKGPRIESALEWRFQMGRVKIPTGPGYNNTAWKLLDSNIKDFTLDLALLSYDDPIDTLAIHAYIPRKSGVPQNVEPVVETYESMLAKGQLTLPGTCLTLINAIDFHKLDDQTLHQIRQNYIDRLNSVRRRRRKPIY